MTDDYPSPEELAELKEVLEMAGVADDRAEKILRACAISKDRYDRFYSMFERKARMEASKQEVRGEFYPYESYPGQFRLGADPDGTPIGLTWEQLNEHMLVVGRTGAGKTTFFYNVMDECTGHGLPFWVFDLKGDYRHLSQHRDVLVVNWRDLKFNPLQPPPGISPWQWGEIVIGTFAHNMSLLQGSEGYVLGKLRELYRLYDPVETSTYPSLFELRKLAAAEDIPYASPRFRYKERLVNRLTLMTGFSGNVFDCSEGYPLEEILDRNVVFELKGANPDVSTFVVEMLLTWLFYYRDVQGHRSGLRHVVMFDEAKRVFDVNRERQPEAGIPPITALMGRVREFGEALIVADHEPSKLSDSLKANTNAKLWMSLGSGKDTDEMRRTFGLDMDETDFTRTLEKGEAVLWLADRDPVPVQLPNYRLEKTVTQMEIREQMRPELEALDWRERIRPDAFLYAIGLTPADEQETGESAKGETGLSEVAEQLLVSVDRQPFLSMEERFDAVGVGKNNGMAAKEELLDAELVREVEVRTGKRGRNPKMLDLTKKGRQMLEEQGYTVSKTDRRGVEHRYWQEQIKTFYESEGFDVEVEFGVSGGRIDVYAERAGTSVAIEVARSPEHELENIEKCLEFGVDRVEVAYLDDNVKSQVESAVRTAFGAVPEEVAFIRVSEYT